MKPTKQLLKKWHKKLKDSGFTDIENSTGHLKRSESSRFRGGQNNGWNFAEINYYNKNKEEYYRRAGHFLHDYEFPTLVDKYIWSWHTDGFSQRKIIAKLKELNIPAYKDLVQDTIARLRKELIKLYRGQSE